MISEKAPEEVLCASCARKYSYISMRRHTYLIIRRGDHLGTKKFCSLDCAAAYVAQVEVDMKLQAEYFLLMPGHICTHYVELSRITIHKPHAA